MTANENDDENRSQYENIMRLWRRKLTRVFSSNDDDDEGQRDEDLRKYGKFYDWKTCFSVVYPPQNKLDCCENEASSTTANEDDDENGPQYENILRLWRRNFDGIFLDKFLFWPNPI